MSMEDFVIKGFGDKSQEELERESCSVKVETSGIVGFGEDKFIVEKLSLKMNRFLVFINEYYEPSGGIGDLKFTFDSEYSFYKKMLLFKKYNEIDSSYRINLLDIDTGINVTYDIEDGMNSEEFYNKAKLAWKSYSEVLNKLQLE